ncbi:unnamed protein product, partial [Laminaria digitata]
MPDQNSIPPLAQNEFDGLIGVAFTEINPPGGMYARTWGSAIHDLSDGLHRPLRATCLSFAAQENQDPLVFMTLDLIAWMSTEDEKGIRDPIEAALGISPGRLIVQLSHSHGAPFTDPALIDAPGGDLIPQYRSDIIEACIKIGKSAKASMKRSTLSWGTGKCG